MAYLNSFFGPDAITAYNALQAFASVAVLYQGYLIISQNSIDYSFLTNAPYIAGELTLYQVSD